eukprot:scaffold97935_cov25-Tisochrysis_lutea.AAC.2
MGGAAAAAAAAKVPLRVGAGPAAGHEGKRGHGNEGEGVLSRCTGEDAVWGQGRGRMRCDDDGQHSSSRRFAAAVAAAAAPVHRGMRDRQSPSLQILDVAGR